MAVVRPYRVDRRDRTPLRRARWRWLVFAGVVVLGAVALGLYRAGAFTRHVAGPKYNLLLITLDTTRADHLGCYGGTASQTPNLDRLAAEGTRFAQCSTCSPLTLPSHASIMTAVCPNVHNARRNGTVPVLAGNVTLAQRLHAAGCRTAAAVASFVLNRQFGLAQGFDTYHDVVPPAEGAALEAERRADAVASDAIELLRSLRGGRFFLWVHFYDAHLPYISAQHTDRFSPEAYADEVSFMDEHVGRLLDELKRLGLDEQTLVVAVGDHGEGLGEHDEAAHGYFLYQTTLHVPLIVRCPTAVAAGQVVAAPVRTIDIAPTILELLDCPSMPNIQGASVVPLLRGEQQPPLPRLAYAETFEAYTQFGLSPLRSLRVGDWKFVLAPHSELHNLAVDPGEAENVASSEPARVAELRETLRQLLAEAPPPVPADPQAGLSAEDAKRLQSLGYIGPATTLPSGPLGELDLFEPRGGNPRTYAPLFQLNSRARDCLTQGRFPAAERLFREVITMLPDAPQPYAGLAEALRGQGRLDDAIAAMQDALARDPEDTYIRGTYGSLLSDAGRWDEAAAELRTVLRRTPRDTVVLHNMGIALAFLGRLDEAEQHFQLALSIEPDSPRLLHAMGVLRSRQQRFAEAATFLRKALALDPQFKQAAVDLQAVERRLNP